MKRTTIMLLMLVALFVAACTSDQAGASASQSAAAQQSDEATPEPAESESAVAFPSLDLPDSAPELEALLPDEIGGAEVIKFSMGGAELMADVEGSGVDPEFVAFLERLGAQPEDISLAFAFSFSAEGDSAAMGAFRVAGANSDDLEREFMATTETEGEAVDWQSASVGGKDVQTAADPDTTGSTIYVYTAGDIVFFVTTQDEATAAELLEPLP